MVDESHRQLVDYLRNQAGDYLRGVARYDSGGHSVIYLRDNLRSRRFKSDVSQMIDRLKQETRARENRAFPFTDLHGTVRLFEEAMVMHYPHTQERGTVITLDPEVGQNLSTFMHECEERIQY